jgi:tetratricopeptide (TPR) repeat protein
VSAFTQQSEQQSLGGLRVAIVGRLAGMSKRDAEKIIRDRGGRVVDRVESADWIVIGDEAASSADNVAASKTTDAVLAQFTATAEAATICESDFWSRLGLLDADLSVARLYTPAMLAGLVGVPVSSIRQWHRQGVLRAVREVRRLAYFDFAEVGAAQKLAALSQAGCSLGAIRRKLDELSRLLPHMPRPLSEPSVVVEGRRIRLRRGEGLAELCGQLLIDFDGPADAGEREANGHVASIPFGKGESLQSAGASPLQSPDPSAAADLRSLAMELEEIGNVGQAIEAYRAILVSGQAGPEDHFALAELLYRAGELAAARERYYVAIELDEDFVEARANLGCVLAELGDTELAESAFRGALACHPHYADAYYHLARLLDRIGKSDEASSFWQEFIRLAPASPWADEAIVRTGGG